MNKIYTTYATEEYVDSKIGELGAGGGAQPDWNQNDPNAADYVKNRTHYSGLQHITFTGDTDGLDIYNGYLYRVHSDTPNINDVIGGTMTVLVDESYMDFTIAESWVKQLTAYPNDGYVINNSVIVFFNDVPNVAKAGIYFSWHQAICQVAGLSYNVRKTLDEKYIPSTIARTEDIPTVAQPDWNQMDETQPDYVKNRTHYVDQFRQVINLNPETDSYYSNYGYHMGGYQSLDPVEKQNSIKIGAHWLTKGWAAFPGTILFDDIVYELTTERRLPITLSLTDAAYPKVKFEQIGSNIVCHIYYDDNKPHRFEWIDANPQIKQLDEVFIPDTITRDDEVNSLIGVLKPGMQKGIIIEDYLFVDSTSNGLLDLYKGLYPDISFDHTKVETGDKERIIAVSSGTLAFNGQTYYAAGIAESMAVYSEIKDGYRTLVPEKQVPLLYDEQGNVVFAIDYMLISDTFACRVFFSPGHPLYNKTIEHSGDFTISLYHVGYGETRAFESLPVWSNTANSDKWFNIGTNDSMGVTVTDIFTGETNVMASKDYVDNKIANLEGLGGSSEVPILTDIVTGTRYELYVENGKLTMKEAE